MVYHLLPIGVLSEECISSSVLSFHVEHGRTKHNCCHHIKIEPAIANYAEVLKKSFARQLF